MFPVDLPTAKFNLGIDQADAGQDILIEGFILQAWARIAGIIGLPWTNNPPTLVDALAIKEAALLFITDAFNGKTVFRMQLSTNAAEMPLAIHRLRPIKRRWLDSDEYREATPEEISVSYQQVKNYLSDSRSIGLQADDAREKLSFVSLAEVVAARRAGWSLTTPVHASAVLDASSATSSTSTILIPPTATDAHLWFWMAGDRILSSIQIEGTGELLLSFQRSSLTVNNVDGTLYTSETVITQAVAGHEAQLL